MIESVPNLSEGCDAPAIAELACASRLSGASLIDIHSDCDHNRSVFTLVGTGDEIEDAVLALADVAIRRIDLRAHCGVHPRVGALDVVPFVPLIGSTMEECIALAWSAGARIGCETRIPVFLYGRATRGPARSLADIRRGGLEGLRARVGTSGWVPDFGPRGLHPTAGAVAVGARPFLVAFNVMLETWDLELGKQIAAATRAKNGGPAGVQALAFPVDGRVQISMNLTDIERTPVIAAFERVRALAAANRTGVRSSEIVGLAPRRAFAGTTAEAIRLVGKLEDHVLEERLESP